MQTLENQNQSNFIVIGNRAWIVLQVLLGINSMQKAQCVVIGGGDTGGLHRSAMCRQYIKVNLRGEVDDGFIRAIEDAKTIVPGATIIPADCDAARIVNRTRRSLSLAITPIPDAETLEIFDNKWRFYKFASQNNLSVPKTALIGSKSSLSFDDIALEYGVPFVIKPVDQQASDGVHVIPSKVYFEQAILNNKDYNYSPLIVQRYIPGVDMGLNLLAVDGEVLAYGIWRRDGDRMEFVSNAYLQRAVFDLCASSRYNGVMNLDVRLNEDTGEAYFIEGNPRFWASHGASVWCGLNFVAESLALRRGHPRVLISGVFETPRHPVIRPSAWWSAMMDRGVHSRILRATIMDQYLLRQTLSRFFLKVAKTFSMRSERDFNVNRPYL